MPNFYDITDLINAGLVGVHIGAALMFAANLVDRYLNKGR